MDAARRIEEPLVLPAELPFPAGKSPFRAKGSIYKGTKRSHIANVPGGTRAVAEAIEDPAVRAFYEQDFLANEWYDYLPVLPIGRAIVKVQGGTPEEVLSEAAERHAERDLSGIYKVLLRFTSPEAAMKRMPRVTDQYFEFLRTEVEVPEPGVAISTIHGMPDIVGPFYRIYVGAFVHRLIELAGGRNPVAIWEQPAPAGFKAGIQLVRMRVRTMWKKG